MVCSYVILCCISAPFKAHVKYTIINEMVEQSNTEVKVVIMSFVDTSNRFLFDMNLKKVKTYSKAYDEIINTKILLMFTIPTQ